MTLDGAHLLNTYDAECTYLLNAYDGKLHQGYSNTLEAYIFVTNKYRATPNTSPDSPSNGESGEMFGVALHLFVIRFLGSWVMNQPWRLCGVICVQKVGAFWRQKVGAFGVLCSKGLTSRSIKFLV